MQDYGVDANTAEEAFDEDELDDSDFEYDHANENISHQSRNLTETERHKIYAALLERSMHGRLKRNTTTRVAELSKCYKLVGIKCNVCGGGLRSAVHKEDRWMLDQGSQ